MEAFWKLVQDPNYLVPAVALLVGVGYELFVNQKFPVLKYLTGWFGSAQPDDKKAYSDIRAVREYFRLTNCRRGVELSDELGKCLFEHDDHNESQTEIAVFSGD